VESQNRHPIELSRLRTWTFLTNHGRLLLAVARYPEATVAKLAEVSKITERSAYNILADLREAGYLYRWKVGRHNRYVINPALPLGEAVVENEAVGDFLRLIHGADVELHLASRVTSAGSA
jgi:DNA-binding IclR family transcriptional regulator